MSEWRNAKLFYAWSVLSGHGTGQPGEVHILPYAQCVTLEDVEIEARQRGIFDGKSWQRPA